MTNRRFIPASLLVLACAATILVLLLPSELKLGGTIKIVILHGALARTGLFAFAAAGALGLVLLVQPKPGLEKWTVATQKTALILWIAAALTSVIATYLSWGVFIAWSEPRTQATAKILMLATAFLALTIWVRQPRFTAVANLLAAVVVWLLVMTAASVQHPNDPIGSSASSAYRYVFVALVAVLTGASLQICRWLRLSPSG